MRNEQRSLFQFIQQAFEVVEVAGIDIQVERVAIAVEELVGGEGVDAEIRLDGRPLFLGPEETA